MRTVRPLILLTRLLLLGLVFLAALPAQADDALDTRALAQSLTRYERELKKRHIELDRLKTLAGEVAELRGQAKACVDQRTPVVAKLKAER